MKGTRRNSLFVGLACVFVGICGCSSDKSADAGEAPAGTPATTTAAENTKCPFSGNPVNAGAKTVAFQGHSVGFCCNGCSEKFAKMTDAEKASTWSKVAAK
jgi:hypothetical protein